MTCIHSPSFVTKLAEVVELSCCPVSFEAKNQLLCCLNTLLPATSSSTRHTSCPHEHCWGIIPTRAKQSKFTCKERALMQVSLDVAVRHAKEPNGLTRKRIGELAGDVSRKRLRHVPQQSFAGCIHLSMASGFVMLWSLTRYTVMCGASMS